VQGVLLSASIGAFAANAPPQLVVESAKDDYRGLWIFLAAAAVIVAFDAWYQLIVNGELLHLDRPRPNGFVVFGVIFAMLATSFLPFQFLVRTLAGTHWGFLAIEPTVRLFAASLFVATFASTVLVLVVGVRESVTANGRDDGPPRDPNVLPLERKAAYSFVYRVACLVALGILIPTLLATRADRLHDAVIVFGVWLLSRALETYTLYRIDKRYIPTGTR
jgi:hypothetical protein